MLYTYHGRSQANTNLQLNKYKRGSETEKSETINKITILRIKVYNEIN